MRAAGAARAVAATKEVASAGARCNGRDAVRLETHEALQRRARQTARCRLDTIVGRRLLRRHEPY
jgi:hypothetical protein